MKALIKLAGAGAAACGLLLAAGGVASASATGHPISGTCYENGSWYVSDNVRTLSSGSSSISASFTQVPSNGLEFGVESYQTGAQLGHYIYAPPTTNQSIATGLGGGTQFLNLFRLESSGHQSNYSFSGSETY